EVAALPRVRGLLLLPSRSMTTALQSGPSRPAAAAQEIAQYGVGRFVQRLDAADLQLLGDHQPAERLEEPLRVARLPDLARTRPPPVPPAVPEEAGPGRAGGPPRSARRGGGLPAGRGSGAGCRRPRPGRGP